MLFFTVGWPITSALAANLAYLYTLPLYTFFSSLYHNVVIQSTSLQYCNSFIYLLTPYYLKAIKAFILVKRIAINLII